MISEPLLHYLDRSTRLGWFLNALSSALLKQRSVTHEIVFSLFAIGLATWIRHVLDGILPPGFPFLTFFPAVMLTLVFSSIRSGIAVALICGIIAWIWFIAPSGQMALSEGAVLAICFYLLITTTDILFISAASLALKELVQARENADKLATSRSLMFSELQHRVSNNLATVAALLRLQASKTLDEGARQALSASQARIKSISRLQRRLHSVDMQSVNAADYLSEVLHDTLDVAELAKPVALTLDIDRMIVPNDVAVPLGLIASELLMNSIEHGMQLERPFAVHVKLRSQPADADGNVEAVLDLSDNGAGLPEGFDLGQSESLGLTVATQFSQSLDGSLNLTNAPEGGTLARLFFRVRSSDSRPLHED